MDLSYSKRAVGGISNAAPKKKPVTIVKDTAGSKDETAQLCTRIGCCGRINHNKGIKNKSLEKPKPKPLRPPLRPASGKEITGSSSKNLSLVTNVKKSFVKSEKKVVSSELKSGSDVKKSFVKSEKRVSSESNSGSNESEIKELNGSRSQHNESNNGRRKRFTQGESSSSGKGKRVIGVSPNEGRVSDPKNSRNLTSCRPNGSSVVRTRSSLNVEPSTESTRSTRSTESSLDGDRSIVRFVNDNNGRRHYNVDGIADVLLALDRMEQDEELTYEQLLSLEANLFLGGLNFYDQHRDMRLDIDNMSYEELLVLEDKMGTVSTALSEDELSKCIKTSIYQSLQLEDGKMRCSSGADDSKCSICQEEFVRGDEIGRLLCGHEYHNVCINQWLGLKNWCPICKVSSSSPPSS